MIEITCNKKQKETIIEALHCPNGCLWPRKRAFCVYDPCASCRDCFEKKIRWTILKRGKRRGHRIPKPKTWGELLYEIGLMPFVGNGEYSFKVECADPVPEELAEALKKAHRRRT